MGRWTQYDEASDEYRLPEGMKRVGYDADSGKYYFRASDGQLWEGPEGAQFGEMRRVSETPAIVEELETDGDVDVEAASGRADGYRPLAADAGASPHRAGSTSPYRTLFPFFVMILVALLLVWRLVLSPGTPQPEITPCSGHGTPYRVKSGDTCWDLAQTGGFSVEELVKANGGLDCAKLTPTQIICLPVRDQVPG